jgi:uncharacterized protein YcfJ
MKPAFGAALIGAAISSILLCGPAVGQDYRYAQDYRYGQDARRDAPAYAPPAVYQDTARVTRVTPRYEQVQMPQEECRMEVEQVQAAPQPQQRNLAGVLIGGVAGGILGNQVGGGNGRAAATAIGAVGGALVGDSMANNANAGVPPGPIERQVRRCHTVNRSVERAAGYDVSYQYNGRNYSTVMQNDPGASLRVNVSVTPAY